MCENFSGNEAQVQGVFEITKARRRHVDRFKLQVLNSAQRSNYQHELVSGTCLIPVSHS